MNDFPKQVSKDSSAQPITLLMVDDEPLVLSALRRSLGNEGYRLIELTDPRNALEIVEREGVDLVLSDVDMPHITGPQLAAALRKKFPQVVRLLLTGGAALPSALQAINEGEVFRYLTKPWDLTELRATLREAVARRHELVGRASFQANAEHKRQLQAALEEAYPGITTIPSNTLEYVIDPNAVAKALAALDTPALRALWG